MPAPLYELTARAYRIVRGAGDRLGGTGAGDRLAATARANAWSAVCADRARAAERDTANTAIHQPRREIAGPK